ncbi:MAG: BTAD domain-containing putative transcriptional regulator [Candidatus Dormibacteria bacterium]
MESRIQLCGRLIVRIEGRRLEDQLPGRQGRLLFVYLAANRVRPVGRDELTEALWPGGSPLAAESALNALLSKLRRVLGPDRPAGRAALRLELPPGAWIDLEGAGEAIHRAESAVALGAWAQAWAPARVALYIARRGFLRSETAPWIEEHRRYLDEVELRALECVAHAGLGLGGPELASAERSGRALVRLAPYRESGYRLLMRSLASAGNAAEAIAVYERLCRRLREDLGVPPAPEIRELHRQLLHR